MIGLLVLMALIFYALAAGAFVRAMRTGARLWVKRAELLLGIGVAFHALELAVRGFAAGNVPVANFPQSLSFFALVMALAALVVILWCRIVVVGVLVVPVIALSLAAAWLSQGGTHLPLPHSLRSGWLPVHVTCAFLGEALLALAASVSLVYLVQDARLKAKRPLDITGERVPSLERLDRMNYRLVASGFLLLSLAILTGAVWAELTWGQFWSWEPIESWTLLSWILYAVLLESRRTAGLSGRRAATLTVAVFAVLVGSYVGVSLLNPGKHGGSFG